MNSKIVLIILGVIAALVVLLVGAFGFILANKPHLPPASFGKVKMTVSTKFHPPHPAWVRLFTTPPTVVRVAAFTDNWKRLLEKSRGWFKDVKQASKYKEQSETVYRQLKSVLATQGCPPPVGLTKGSMPQYIILLRVAHLLGLRAVVQAQQGQPDPAALELLGFLGRLQSQLRNCHTSLLFVMVWFATRNITLSYLRYPLTHPNLSADVRNKVLRRLKAIEKGTFNPMPEAFRAEYQYISHHIDRAIKSKSQEPKPFLHIWPWWDPQHTKQLMAYSFAPTIYRASLPLGPKFWKSLPTDKVLSEFQSKFSTNSSWMNLLQYNFIGIRLVLIASPSYRKFILRRFQSLCLTAATRAWGVRQAQQHKQTVPPELATMNNPLTGKPFGDLRKPVCAITPTGYKTPVFKGKWVNIRPWPGQKSDPPQKPDPK